MNTYVYMPVASLARATPVREKRGLLIVLYMSRSIPLESRGIVLSVYCLWSAWFIAISSGFHLKP